MRRRISANKARGTATPAPVPAPRILGTVDIARAQEAGAGDQFEHRAGYGGYRHGQAPFAPAMMVAVLIYAYANGHRSSRKIERLCWRDVGFRMSSASTCRITA